MKATDSMSAAGGVYTLLYGGAILSFHLDGHFLKQYSVLKLLLFHLFHESSDVFDFIFSMFYTKQI